MIGRPRGVLVMAHRGGAGLYPENTLLAFSYAIGRHGADVLEVDVRATRDGHIVVVHDRRVDRTTDGLGKVSNFTLGELKKLDAGYCFTTDGGKTYPYRDKGLSIPTLQEVFAFFPNTRFNIEIQQVVPSIEQKLYQLILSRGMQKKVMVAAKNDLVRRRFNRINEAGIAISASILQVMGFLICQRLKLPTCPVVDALQVPEKFGFLKIMTLDFIEAAHSQGMAVHVWIVNRKEDMKRLIAMGVDGIITDYPDRLQEVLKE